MTEQHYVHGRVKELVRAVQAFCLFAAEDGTVPDEEALTRTFTPFVDALIHHNAPPTRKERPHGLG